MKSLGRMFIVAGAVSLLAATGCGRKKESGNFLANKIAEKAIEAQSDGKAKVEINGQNVSVKTAEGQYQMNTGGGLKIPADFPKEVPIYAAATPIQVMTTPQGVYAMLKSSDSQSQIVDFYKQKMAADGWATEVTVQNAGSDMASFSKGEQKLAVVVSHSDSDNTSLISLTFNRKP